MFLSSRFKKNLLSAALLWGVALSAGAAIQELTAVFRPDSQYPLNNKFTNTTPESGICPGHMPAQCKALGIFSIRTNDIVFRSNGPMPFNPSGPMDPRKGVMFKMPSEWRPVTVVSDTGEQETVEMRIAGIGNRFDVTRPASIHSWAPRTWLYAPAPCVPTYFITGTGQWALWFWLVPEGIGACNLINTMEIPGLVYGNFEYAYELRTPNPLTMSTGIYRGSIPYSLGPGRDFDFGDIMTPNDDSLVFNFTLSVEHVLKVEIPPGGNNIELVPQGGWQSWVQQGRRPTRLYRDQTFNIWASGHFKMQMECQYLSNNTCAIQSEGGESVPLNISVSLPNGLGDANGQPVNRLPLLVDGSTTRLFAATRYVDRRPGILHFEVPAAEVAPMFKPGAPSKYSGNVTVIWDSEV
jgi:hypothetical protein